MIPPNFSIGINSYPQQNNTIVRAPQLLQNPQSLQLLNPLQSMPQMTNLQLMQQPLQVPTIPGQIPGQIPIFPNQGMIQMIPQGGYPQQPNPMQQMQPNPMYQQPTLIQSTIMPQIQIQPSPIQTPGQLPPIQPIQPIIKQQTEQWRKLFMKDIPEDVSDEFVEKLLKECGELVSWKRNKNEKGQQLSFGIVEFKTVEGVLKCLRLLNELKILDKTLHLNPSQKTEMFLKEWKDLKQKEWQLKSTEEAKEYPNFEAYLQKDDIIYKDRIKTLLKELDKDMEKIKEEKDKEEEKKQHPREQDREARRKQFKKENERGAKERIQDWLKQEEDRKKEKKKEKEKEKEREKQKQKILDKELTMDSDEERKFKTKYRSPERKKFRQKELEEDEMELKKELLRFVPQEPEMFNVEQPLPPNDDDSEEQRDDQEAQGLKKPAPSTLKMVSNEEQEVAYQQMSQKQTDQMQWNTTQSQMGASITSSNQTTIQNNFQSLSQSNSAGGATITFNIFKKPNKPNTSSSNITFETPEEEEQDVKEKKKLVLPKISLEKQKLEQQKAQEEQKRQEELKKKDEEEKRQQEERERVFLELKQREMEIEQERIRDMEIEKQQNYPEEQQNLSLNAENNQLICSQENQDQQIQRIQFNNIKKTSQQIKEEIKQLLKSIPDKKQDLFAYNINWSEIAKNNILDKKVQPWLMKKSVEYIGQEEQTFVKMIVKRLSQCESAESILKKVDKILDEDAEEFVIQLWRMLIFEQLKIEKGLA